MRSRSLVRELLHLLEAAAGHELADDHPLVAEARDDVGDDDERVAAEDARQAPLVLGLELVVELLLDARADLGAQRLGVEARRDRLHEPQDHPEVLHVRAHRGVDARVLDLDRDVAPVVEARLVDLADRGGGDRHRVERLEDLVERLVVLLLDDLLHVLEGDLRRRVAQLGELGLELLAVLLGDQADVEERHHLAELHRRALHRPQRGDDLLGGLELAAWPAPSQPPRPSASGWPRASRPGARPARPPAARPSPSAAGATWESGSCRDGPRPGRLATAPCATARPSVDVLSAQRGARPRSSCPRRRAAACRLTVSTPSPEGAAPLSG